MLAIDFITQFAVRAGEVKTIPLYFIEGVGPVSRVYKQMDYDSGNPMVFGPSGWLSLKSKEVNPILLTSLEKETLSPQFVTDLLKVCKFHSYAGCDPEIFIEDVEGNLVPAWTRLNSKKENGYYYWDGFQAEFAPRERECLESLLDGISTQLSNIQATIRPGERLSLRNTFEISQKVLDETADEYVAFGCKPSFCAYGDMIQPGEFNPRTVPFRSAGGHLHFTLPKEYKHNEEKIGNLVKLLDRTLGVISVPLFQYWDTPQRRVMYGRAGEFRMPDHGLEYRVLSNAWLCHPIAYNLVFELARRALGIGINNVEEIFNTYWNITEDEAVECINTCNVGMAVDLLKRNKTGLDILLNSLPRMDSYASNSDTLCPVIFNGFHSVLRNLNVLYLDKTWHSGVQYIRQWDGGKL